MKKNILFIFIALLLTGCAINNQTVEKFKFPSGTTYYGSNSHGLTLLKNEEKDIAIKSDSNCKFIGKAKFDSNVNRILIDIYKGSCFRNNNYYESTNLEAYVTDHERIGIDYEVKEFNGYKFAYLKPNTPFAIVFKRFDLKLNKAIE